MPKSKRNRVVPTSKVKKSRKELVRRLHTNVQQAASEYRFIWVFSVQNMRNTFIKKVRSDFTDSRFFMGKTKLMAHALGSSTETEHLPGLAALREYLSGEVGVLCTNRSTEEIEEYFTNFVESDYARAGVTAQDDFLIPKGVPLTTHYGVEDGEEDPISMAIEPRLRKLNIPTRIVRGKVILEESAEAEDVMNDDEGYVVCRAGDVLDSRQTEILKIFGARMAEFRVNLSAVYDKTSAKVRKISSMDVD